jgi:hypothetical protein
LLEARWAIYAESATPKEVWGPKRMKLKVVAPGTILTLEPRTNAFSTETVKVSERDQRIIAAVLLRNIRAEFPGRL